MQATYLITHSPEKNTIQQLIFQLHKDIEQGINIKQIFFYGDAVAIGTQTSYTHEISQLIGLTDENDITLSICSAGFQKRHYHLSDTAKQDFSFKGLGQFIAENSSIDLARLVPQTITNLNKTTEKSTYTLLISIRYLCYPNNLKELLDIALVSASYNITTAVFINAALITVLQQQTDPTIEQVFNMLADFSVRLFSDTEHMLYEQTVTATNWEQLQQSSQHHYAFHSL